MPQASNMNGGTYELGLLSSRVNHYPTAPAAVLFARRDLSLSLSLSAREVADHLCELEERCRRLNRPLDVTEQQPVES